MSCIDGFTVTALMLAMVLAAHATTADSKPMTNERLGLPPATNVATVRNVFSADFCGPCHKLHASLERAGAKFHTVEIRQQPAVDAFPTVYYDLNGHMVHDNGERILMGNYRLPKGPVEVIEYVTQN